MSKVQLVYDEQEVNEIIELKIANLKGNKNKLTFNNIRMFNEEIAQNHQFLRSNGKFFTKYSYTFWGDKNYYGYQQIKRIKEENEEFVLVGEVFIPEVKDILLLVKKYIDNPEKLTTMLVKLFESDKKELNDSREQIKNLKIKRDGLQQQLAQFKSGFATIFMNSIDSHNSLRDVFSLKKSEDNYILDELRTMFDNDLSLFEHIDNYTNSHDNIAIFNPRQSIDDKIKELEDEGF